MAEAVSSRRCPVADGPWVRARAPTNTAIAAVLDEVARLLEVQGASRARVRAYRRLVAAVRRLQRPACDVLAAKGVAGLAAAAKTSCGLAAAIAEIAATGGLGLLDALRGDVRPEQLLVREAGIGSRLARRVEEALGIVTLAELRVAAIDGRLASVPGFGPRRVRTVHRALGRRVGGGRGCGGRRSAPLLRVPVDELLDVDRQYRALMSRVEAGTEGRSGVPILHAARGARQYTALFARTALARALDKTGDWVLIYVEAHRGRRQAMVVTETVGPQMGHRVVRGREHESRQHPERSTLETALPCEWRGSRSLRRRRDAPGGARTRADRAPRSRGPRGPRRSPASSPGGA
jgi:hypothetical protein